MPCTVEPVARLIVLFCSSILRGLGRKPPPQSLESDKTFPAEIGGGGRNGPEVHLGLLPSLPSWRTLRHAARPLAAAVQALTCAF